MRLVLAWLLLVACVGDTRAQGVKIDRIDIVETGIFRARTTGTESAHGTAAGVRHVLSGATLVKPATRIEAMVGLHFGMRFRVIGRPYKAPIRLISVTHYPKPGLKNPKTGSMLARGEHVLAATVGLINYRGYLFEHDWELVPGTWTFELWDGKRMLAKQAFEVVKP